MRKIAILIILALTARAYMLFIPHYGWDETIYTYLVLSLYKYGIFSYSLNNPLVEAFLASAALPTDKLQTMDFTLPLFVHPPLFSYLLLSISKVIGSINIKTIVASGFILNTISVFVFSILIVKHVSKDEKLAFYFSLLALTEPVLWLSSMKIWMDAFLGMLSACFIYFYLKALKNETKFIFLAGITGGLLLETKLSSLPIVLCVAAHSMLKIKENKKFIFVPVISIAFLLPWILWNYSVYGFNVPAPYLEYTMSFKPKIYEKWAHPLAYFIYLPAVSPIIFLGYINLLKTKRIDFLKITLIFVTIIFSAFSATRELRYITPLLFIHFILAAELLSEKKNLLKYVVFFILIYNIAIVFLTFFFLKFSYAPDIIILPLRYLKILIL